MLITSCTRLLSLGPLASMTSKLVRLWPWLCILVSASYCSVTMTQIDETLEPNATGGAVVHAVLMKLDSLPDTCRDKELGLTLRGIESYHHLLRRIAFVETEDGAKGVPAGGIWAIKEEHFNLVTIHHVNDNCNPKLFCDEQYVNYGLTNVPLLSGLAAYLYLYEVNRTTPIPLAENITGQALFWCNNYSTEDHDCAIAAETRYRTAVEKLTEKEGNVSESPSSHFFIAFGGNNEKRVASVTLRLFISSTEPDPVPVTVESLRGFTFTGIATNNETLMVDIPNTFQVNSSFERDKGLRVAAKGSNIVVYGLNYHMYTSDAFLALPCDRLHVETYEYYGLTYFGSGISQIVIVSCEDGSLIQIGSEIIELDRMETYLLENSTELTGTRIISNRPLAVYPGNRCTDIPRNSSFCDHITEQVPPTAIWGRNFMSASCAGRRSGDIYRVLASQNSTTVTVNCSTVTQLLIYELESPGSWKEFSTPANSFCSISSNKPLLVMQFGLGNSHDGIGDPFMMMITPVEQYSNNYVFDVLPEFFSNYITIYVTPDNFSPQDIIVDDDSLENAVWTTVYCTDTMICGYITYVNLTAGQHQLYHRDDETRIGVSAYGFSYTNSYGYPGGFQFEYAVVGLEKMYYHVYEDDGMVEVCATVDTANNVKCPMSYPFDVIMMISGPNTVSYMMRFGVCEKRRCMNVSIVNYTHEGMESISISLQRTSDLDSRIILAPVNARITVIDNDCKGSGVEPSSEMNCSKSTTSIITGAVIAVSGIVVGCIVSTCGLIIAYYVTTKSYKSPGGKGDVDVEHNPSYGMNYHRPSEPSLAGPSEAVYETLPL